jgi:hypothetical protein
MKKNAIISTILMIISIILIISAATWNNSKNSDDTESWIQKIYSNIVAVFKPAKKSVYLVAWWDIMLSRNIWYFAKNEWYDRIFKTWNYNPVSSFENCSWDDCLLFFNLESLFNENDNDIPKWWFLFRSNPKNVETLLQLRQDHAMILSLANNHTINATYDWVVQTKEILDSDNILRAWVWTSTWESRKFAVYEKNGIKICIWAYSYEWQYVKVWAWKISWNKTDEKIMKEDLALMAETGCDAKILSLHRWAEYRISPNAEQKRLAHSLIDAWADLILWWHSHVPWDFEIYSGKYVFYSFWNFIFDQSRWKRTPWWNYDHIFDYSLNKKTVPTYISLAAGLNIEKIETWVNITLEKIVMSTLTDWIPSPLDAETYSWIMERIQK